LKILQELGSHDHLLELELANAIVEVTNHERWMRQRSTKVTRAAAQRVVDAMDAALSHLPRSQRRWRAASRNQWERLARPTPAKGERDKTAQFVAAHMAASILKPRGDPLYVSVDKKRADGTRPKRPAYMRLAAALYGDPNANLYHQCKDVK